MMHAGQVFVNSEHGSRSDLLPQNLLLIYGLYRISRIDTFRKKYYNRIILLARREIWNFHRKLGLDMKY